jgi:hypothetical protein
MIIYRHNQKLAGSFHLVGKPTETPDRQIIEGSSCLCILAHLPLTHNQQLTNITSRRLNYVSVCNSTIL